MTHEAKKPNAVQPKYAPTAEEIVAAQKVCEHGQAMGPAPRVKVRNNRVSVDHADTVTGNILLLKALGTASFDFKDGLVLQLANAQPPGSIESGLNFALSVVAGVGPRDQIEAMLSAHMVIAHGSVMRAARRLAHAESRLELEFAETSFQKSVRTFTTLTDALKRHRAVCEQNVMVQNVSVGDGGQAVVTQNAAALPRPQPTSVLPPSNPEKLVAPTETIENSEAAVIAAKANSQQ